MDKGFQEGGWQGNDYCVLLHPCLLLVPDSLSGFYNRFRKTQKYPCEIRQRIDPDYSQGNEESRRDQNTERARVLQAQVPFFYSFAPLQHLICQFRMAASREKQRTHRAKVKAAAGTSVRLHEPLSMESSSTKEKIKVPVKAKTALIQGEGRSMGMDID